MKKTILLFAACTAFLMAGCSAGDIANTTTETPAPQTDAATQDDSQTESAAPDAESTEAPEETVASLGDKITVGNWKICAKKASVQTKIQNGKFQYFKPSKGKTFVVINLSVKNTAEETAEFLPRIGYADTMTSASLYDENEEEYKPTELIAYSKDMTTEKIEPDSTKKGILVFEVPKKTGKAKKNLKLQFKAEGESASYTLK